MRKQSLLPSKVSKLNLKCAEFCPPFCFREHSELHSKKKNSPNNLSLSPICSK